MRILFVSAVFPYPLTSGGQVRIYHLLKVLSKKHRITLFSFIRSDRERDLTGRLPFLKEIKTAYRGKRLTLPYLYRTLTGPYPLLLTSYDNARMREMLTEETAAGGYDLVHIEPFYVYPSLPRISIPLVVAEHNIEHVVYKGTADTFGFALLRPLLRWESRRIGEWEGKVLKNADAVTAVSAADAGYLRQFNPRLAVIENGVDTVKFSYRARNFPVELKTVLFFGNFLWYPNVEAVTRLVRGIWPDIRKRFPDLALRIVGNRAPRRFNRPREGINVVGVVPDIVSELHHADCLLAPFGFSGGTKYKLLESMAAGLPVITTYAGASGLQFSDNEHLKIAETPAEFLSAVATLTQRNSGWSRITGNARKLVEERYCWEAIGQKLSDLWEKTAK